METKATDSNAVMKLQTTSSTKFHDKKKLPPRGICGVHLLTGVRYDVKIPDDHLRIDERPRDKYSVSIHRNADVAQDIPLSPSLSLFCSLKNWICEIEWKIWGGGLYSERSNLVCMESGVHGLVNQAVEGRRWRLDKLDHHGSWGYFLMFFKGLVGGSALHVRCI